MNQTVEVDCPECDGSGRESGGDKCRECYGEGTITVAKPQPLVLPHGARELPGGGWTWDRVLTDEERAQAEAFARRKLGIR